MSSQSTSDSRVTIEFQPHEKVTRVPAGTTIFNAANWIGLPIDSTCGARGTCGKCKVRLLQGEVPVTAADRKVFDDEQLGEGWRLSCRAEAQMDMVCDVPRLMGNPKAALMGMGRHVILDPNVHKVYLELETPTLEDQTSDYDRIREALDKEGFEIHTTLPVLQRLPVVLRESRWKVTAVVVGSELVSVELGDTTERSYGLAFDVGTTTVVGMLLDLKTGATAAIKSMLNQQASAGADVIARISHTQMNDDGLTELQDLILNTLNSIIASLLTEAEVEPHEVYEAVFAGNATMMHLLAGMPPEAIGVTPFIPVVEHLLQFQAKEIGLGIMPQAQIHLLPHLGAYVGGDLVGGVLSTGLAQEKGIRLLVDVGTNGEIILGSVKRTVATAAPAGPAFEGAQIKDGMRASDGAIEAVTILPDEINLQVIGDVPPLGICGSGLLDIVAQLRLIGFLDPSGRFVTDEQALKLATPEIAQRLISGDNRMRGFVVATAEESGHGRPVMLTQRDIRELQFAKGAIASGIDVVLREMGIGVSDLEEIYLAGSFGSYINPQSARIIGLVPAIPVGQIKAVGNSAGEGAKMALLSFRERDKARSIPDIIEYHELSGRADFNDSFIDMLQFPKLETLDVGELLEARKLSMKL